MVEVAEVEITPQVQDSPDTRRLNARVQLPIAALESEGSIQDLSIEDLGIRADLVRELRKLPKEAFSTLRHFQTQVGCMGRCAFCSQSAGVTIWNMPRASLANLISALKTVCLEHAVAEGRVTATPLNGDHVYAADFKMPMAGLLANSRTSRVAVVYPYLDNDPASYPHLDDMIKWLHEDLGVTVRIATVGFSRQNQAIQQMHENISRNLLVGLAGFRLSFSPYTYGWTPTAEKRGDASRSEFEKDTASLLSTYRQLFLERKGRKDSCVEIRFRPSVHVDPVSVTTHAGCTVIRCGSYLVIQKTPGYLPFANITSATSHANDLDEPGSPCDVIRALPEVLEAHTVELARAVVDGKALPIAVHARYEGLLHRLQNDDGEYYAVDAERTSKGVHSKFFYPKTDVRPKAGMIDGERYHLNAMMEAKTQGCTSSWEHVVQLHASLEAKALSMSEIEEREATYIRNEVVGLLQSYVRSLQLADYPALFYFDKHHTVDTGHICNLGRAYGEYKAIASRPDLPLTPKHERAFGPTGELAEEGIAWRLSVVPQENTKSALGARNVYQEHPSILFEKLDLAMTATSAGQSQERFFIRTQPIQKITLKDAADYPMIPGHVARKSA